MKAIRLQEPFAFTKGCRTMKIAAQPWVNPHNFGTTLFDLEGDPRQDRPIHDAAAEKRMTGLQSGLMRDNDAPPEQYERLQLPN